jgi:hypothetical protein
MTSEIRALDSDMQARSPAGRQVLSPLTRRRAQMLVYENYSKFITATDTIRRMKDNVVEMGGRMDELQVRCAAAAGSGLALTRAAAVHHRRHGAGERARERQAGQAPRRD